MIAIFYQFDSLKISKTFSKFKEMLFCINFSIEHRI